jgi:hypothetical protein
MEITNNKIIKHNKINIIIDDLSIVHHYKILTNLSVGEEGRQPWSLNLDFVDIT